MQSHKIGDRLQQAFTVAERQSEFFEVAISQIGEHVHVDLVVTEIRLVLTEAEIAKPPADIHGRPTWLGGIIVQSGRCV